MNIKEKLKLRIEISRDEGVLIGLKLGWSMGLVEASSRFESSVDSLSNGIIQARRELKNIELKEANDG